MSRIPAAVLDSGLASLATFASGLFAARMLGADALGAYAIVFAGFNLAALISTYLIFTPFEVEAVRLPRGHRLHVIRDSIHVGVPVALLSAAALAGCALVLPQAISPGIATALLATAIASALVSPIQDHVRRMFHLNGASGCAAAISLVHLVVVAGVLVASPALGFAPAWGPFGALAAGNLVSLLVALLLKPGGEESCPPISMRLGTLLRSGTGLLLAGILPAATTFASATTISSIAGAAVLGHTEAARLVAQPLFVFSVALAAVLGPQATEAAQQRSRGEALRVSFEFRAWLIAAGFAYGAVVGMRHGWNPFMALLPKAYVVNWLVAVWVLANIANGLMLPQRSELLGAEKVAALLKVEAIGAAVRVSIAGTAAATGPFALPAGQAVLGAVRWLAYKRALHSYYGAALVTNTASTNS